MDIFVDCRMKNKFLRYFQDNGFNIIKVLENKLLYDEISSHVDIFACSVNGKVFLSSNINLSIDGFENAIYGESVENFYPNDVKYNVCVTKKYAILNEKYVSSKILEEIKHMKLEIISVKQGYTKCNLVALNDRNYITSDIGIKNELEKRNLNVLYMPDEDIKLLDRSGNYSKMKGFIGGACLVFENKFIVFGDINKLKNGQALREFVTSNGFNVIDFVGEDVIDYGGAIVV